MVIIYNLSGLLIGGAGVVLGLLLTGATGKLGIGALALALVWLVLGFMWRSWKTPPGQPRPYPSAFFIPLPVLAILIIPLAVCILMVEVKEGGLANGPGGASDPRAASFKNDERSLNGSAVGGDVQLSQYLATSLAAHLSEEAKSDKYHIFTRINPESVLVLVKAPNLKSYKESARVQLLRVIGELLSERDDLKGKKAYIGVKGKLTFGAIKVPPDRVETGSVVLEHPLYDFYGPVPGASADGQPSSSPDNGSPKQSPDDADVPKPVPVDEHTKN